MYVCISKVLWWSKQVQPHINPARVHFPLFMPLASKKSFCQLHLLLVVFSLFFFLCVAVISKSSNHLLIRRSPQTASSLSPAPTTTSARLVATHPFLAPTSLLFIYIYVCMYVCLFSYKYTSEWVIDHQTTITHCCAFLLLFLFRFYAFRRFGFLLSAALPQFQQHKCHKCCNASHHITA